MPVVAVPRYITDKDPDFYVDTPPGHRFYLYLPVWGINEQNGELLWTTKDRVRKYDKKGAFKGWENIENEGYACEVVSGDVPVNPKETPRQYALKDDSETRQRVSLKRWNKMMSAIMERQYALAATLGDHALTLHAKSTAPFATGLGNEHPLENGFAFLWPYGLPYLPGSGVKGVVRRAAQELAEGLWGETQGWSCDARWDYPVKSTGERREKPRLSMIDLLFGREPPSGDSDHFRGCLTFWDVFPQIHGNKLRVEIMTPHQKHYYQEGEAPHDSGMPVPISFLSIPPQSQFTFHVVCDTQRLEKLAPDLVNQWQDLLRAAFQHAFEWLGFGAKTAVGYGVMERDEKAEAAAREEQARLEQESRKASMSEEERKIEDLRELYEKEKAAGRLQPQGPVAERRVKLLQEALQWEDPELRRKAGELLRQIAKDLKWPRRREREAKAQVRELLGENP